MNPGLSHTVPRRKREWFSQGIPHLPCTEAYDKPSMPAAPLFGREPMGSLVCGLGDKAFLATLMVIK